MADCYYHGYTGSPGPCQQCRDEERMNLDRGSTGPALPADAVWEAANINSIGREAVAKLERARKSKSSRA
jgi:hypothetical protein